MHGHMNFYPRRHATVRWQAVHHHYQLWRGECCTKWDA